MEIYGKKLGSLVWNNGVPYRYFGFAYEGDRPLGQVVVLRDSVFSQILGTLLHWNQQLLFFVWPKEGKFLRKRKGKVWSLEDAVIDGREIELFPRCSLTHLLHTPEKILNRYGRRLPASVVFGNG